MSNHVHYLLEPEHPDDLPKLMHWLNWYTAMCFNRILKRTGHFWEKRYYSTGFEKTDHERALNTLRYIHANPKAAKMQQGFFYDFSNYGTYNRLTDDGLTQWHPAFLELGTTLEECSEKYQEFCQRYTPRAKQEKPNPWGNRFLNRVPKGIGKTASKKISPGQIPLPGWEAYQVSKHPEIHQVAETFITANAYSTAKKDGNK
jgi:putative transposase